MKKILLSAIFSLGLIFVAGSQTAAQTVTGSIGSVSRGGSVKGTVVMNIPAGLHVNSNRPDSQYSIPTTLRVSSPNAKLSAVSYPRGKSRKFQFSENAINVYEGRVAFNFNVAVPANFRGNEVRVRAVVRYQACTDEVCYPPKTQEITLTANVK
jgi:thiol:disulfide interchange protein